MVYLNKSQRSKFRGENYVILFVWLRVSPDIVVKISKKMSGPILDKDSILMLQCR